MWFSKCISPCGDDKLQDMYLEYVRDLQKAAPSLIPYIAPVTENIINSDYYSAIKNADKLLKKEEELFGETLKSCS